MTNEEKEKKTIRVGIFGEQAHTGKFIDLLKAGGAVPVVFWDDDPEKGKAIAEKFSLPFQSDLSTAMDGSHIDTAVITSPSILHRRLLKEAAKRGLNVFLEKPLCVLPEDADAILAALKTSKGKFYMSDPFVRSEVIAMKHLMTEGKLGEITSAYFRIGHLKNWDHFDRKRQQGGILSDVGIHGLHMIHYLFGKPSGVTAVLNDVSGHEAEDNVTAILSYPSGCQVCFQASWVSGGNTNRAVLYGTKGFVSAQACFEKPGLGELCWTDREKGIMDLKLPKAPVEHIEYFLRMIREDIDNDRVGIDEDSLLGVNAQTAYELCEMMNMIYAAAAHL